MLSFQLLLIISFTATNAQILLRASKHMFGVGGCVYMWPIKAECMREAVRQCKNIHLGP